MVVMSGSRPMSIAAGRDGNLWFIECGDAASRTYNGVSVVARLDQNSNKITAYGLSFASPRPYDIAASPDGAIGFA